MKNKSNDVKEICFHHVSLDPVTRKVRAKKTFIDLSVDDALSGTDDTAHATNADAGRKQ